MNDRTFEQLLNAWMELGPTTAPDRVAEAARLEARTTRQTAGLFGWPPRRTLFMNNTVRYALAAAVLAAAALLGYTYLVAPNVGGPPAEDRTPIPSPTAAPFDLQPAGNSLIPGTYFTTVSGHRISFTVPEVGWQRNVVPHVLWSGNSEARISFGQLDTIYADPCRPELGEIDPPPGPTADDLAAALEAIPGVEATSVPTDLAGYSGRLVTLEVPAEFGDCIETGGEALLGGEGPLEPGRHRFWILDVGETRIVIGAVDRPGAIQRQVGEIDTIVGSVQIDPP